MKQENNGAIAPKEGNNQVVKAETFQLIDKWENITPTQLMEIPLEQLAEYQAYMKAKKAFEKSRKETIDKALEQRKEDIKKAEQANAAKERFEKTVGKLDKMLAVFKKGEKNPFVVNVRASMPDNSSLWASFAEDQELTELFFLLLSEKVEKEKAKFNLKVA